MQGDPLRGKSEELITNSQESVELVESFKEKKCLSSIEEPVKKVVWELGSKDVLEKYKIQGSPKLTLKKDLDFESSQLNRDHLLSVICVLAKQGCEEQLPVNLPGVQEKGLLIVLCSVHTDIMVVARMMFIFFCCPLSIEHLKIWTVTFSSPDKIVMNLCEIMFSLHRRAKI